MLELHNLLTSMSSHYIISPSESSVPSIMTTLHKTSYAVWLALQQNVQYILWLFPLKDKFYLPLDVKIIKFELK